jgi:hypothetical protein
LTFGRIGAIYVSGTQPPGFSLINQWRCACGVALPKKAALYSMSIESEQCLTR